MTTGYVEKSLETSSSDIEKINRFTRSDFGEEELYVFNVVLCNNDIDRDNEKFTVSTLKQLKDMFVGKTGIFDHSMKASDQKARIFDTYVERLEGRKTADNEDFYQLKAKAYMVKSEENLPLIREIEAGIKKEVSISCSVEKCICSVCGADRKSKRCEHIPGKSYGSKRAFTLLEGCSDAYEFSFVAVPAQREAGVTKSFDCKTDCLNTNSKEGFNMTDIIKSLRDCDTDITLSKAQAQSLAEKISTLDDEAKLGREYKKALAGEVVSLCAKAMPNMDLNVFGNVASIMTTNELLAFKKAFSKANYDKTVTPQLKAEKTVGNVNQFKI